MASGLFAILDDVALLLDDAAAMSKVAAKKTAGLLGDDLAVNAEKATGFKASRELPVIWAITKGSVLNKLIILPMAFLLSAYASWLIIPILLLGGAYLSYEGVEKIVEWLSNKSHAQPAAKTVIAKSELLISEATKIQSAIRTDFILSIEIIIITLETVLEHSLSTQLMVVSFIALLATVGVYGMVALLVRLDDSGFYLIERGQSLSGLIAKLFITSGQALVSSLPVIIRLLTVIGTVAMLLVGGGMFVHNLEFVHHTLAFLPLLLAEFAAGLIVGFILVIVMHFIKPHKQHT